MRSVWEGDRSDVCPDDDNECDYQDGSDAAEDKFVLLNVLFHTINEAVRIVKITVDVAIILDHFLHLQILIVDGVASFIWNAFDLVHVAKYAFQFMRSIT